MRLPQNAPPKKSFQVSRWLIVTIVAVVAALFVVVLWFVYPEIHMHRDQAQVGVKHDEIANLYLRHEVEKNPNDIPLRLKLIGHEIDLGNINQANALIAPYIKNEKLPKGSAWKFEWYDFQIKYLKATAAGRKKKKNDAVVYEGLAKKINRLNQAPLSLDQRLLLLQQAVSIKSYSLALTMSRYLFERRSELTANQLSLIGRMDYLSGEFLLSAKFYMASYYMAKDSVTKKKVYVDAINSLLAGELLPKHFSLVLKESEQFKQDPEVLMVLAKAALASHQSKLAAKWMRQAIGLTYTANQGGA